MSPPHGPSQVKCRTRVETERTLLPRLLARTTTSSRKYSTILEVWILLHRLPTVLIDMLFLHFRSFYVYNNNTNTVGSTYIKQNTPSLCTGTTYKLTYSSQITINGGQPGRACSVRISLADQQLVFIGPPNGDLPPFSYQTRDTTFTYLGTRTGNVFTVEFSCNAPQGSYIIDDISLVGV